jgi:hypothetical protein
MTVCICNFMQKWLADLHNAPRFAQNAAAEGAQHQWEF